MSAVFFVIALIAGAWLVSLMEQRLSTGRISPFRPITSGLAKLGRESVVPQTPDRTLFETAPVLLLVAAVLAAAVLPLSENTIFVDLATGALFVNAALVYVMVALVMAGWSANSPYGIVGGWRFLGQLIAYSMLIVMPITAVAMRAESLFVSDIVESQQSLWNIVQQPIGFVLFVIAAAAVAFVAPLDLPTAPGELAGGVEGEYSGVRHLVFRLARIVLIVTVSAATAAFFLGGWFGPLLPGWVWMGVKTLVVAASILTAGHYMPRLANDDVLEWGWKIGIPLALANIAWVGILLLLLDA